MSTAELEAPLAPQTEPTAAPAPPVVPQANGETPAVVEKPSRSRGDNGRFRAKDAVERFEAKKSAREESTPAPVAAEKPEPVEKDPSKVTPTAIDINLVKRAEASGITEYEARRLGDKLEAEIVKRSAEKQQAAAHAPQHQAATQTPAQQSAQPVQQRAEDALSKLTDLPPEYGDEAIQRDRLLREELQRSRDDVRQLLTLRDEIANLKASQQEDVARREADAHRVRIESFDAAVGDLGTEFVPVFGRGNAQEVANSPYERTRDEAFRLAQAMTELRPGLDFKQAVQAAAFALYPDLHQDRIEKTVLDRARKSAVRVSHPGGSSADPTEGFQGDMKRHPVVRRAVERIQATATA